MKLIRKNSPNHYDGRRETFGEKRLWKADCICCHQTGNDSLQVSLAYYMNKASQCSPNFLMDKNGDTYYLVDMANGAWANGTALDKSDPKWYGYSTNSLVKGRKTNANLFTISIEYVHCQYGNITDAQVKATVELIKTVIIPFMKANGVTPKIDRQHIFGHSEVSPKTRDPEKFNCPGKKFPFDKIIAGVLGVIDVNPSTEEKVKFAVGDKVKVSQSATLYAGSTILIPAYIKTVPYFTIDRMMSDRARLKEIWSWVYLKDLEKIK